MSFELSRGDRKIMIITAAAFLTLAVLVSLFVSPESDQKAAPSTYSSNASGAKAAYLLLQETGYPIERWEQPFTELAPDARGQTLIIAEPERVADQEQRAAVHKFVSSGGTLIAIGRSLGSLLPYDCSIPDNEDGKGWNTYSAMAPSSITRAAPRITMARHAHWTTDPTALLLYGDDQDAVVVTYRHDKGKVIWWAAATPLTNAGIKEPGNLEFFLACIGDKQHTRVLWDEYSHGYSRAGGPRYEDRLAVGTLAQLLFLAAAVVWTFSRRSGPVRPSMEDVRLSPLEFVETLGGLYERAHASAVAVDIYYQRFLYWLTKRLGMPGNSSIEQLERAAYDRWGFHDEQFGPVLRKSASARHASDLTPAQALQLVRALHLYAIQLRIFPALLKENQPWKPFRRS